jgi:surface polysaccharide O-acyltransferase-like enzyme
MIGSLITYAGVNIFAVISGYVSALSKSEKTDYSRYIEIWLTVIFYNIVLSAILSFVIPGYTLMANLKTMLTPVTSNVYWYFTSFTGLYLLKPLIDRGLKNCSENTLKKLLVVIFLIFSGLASFSDIFNFDRDLFVLSRGYSVIWIVILYIVGYILNKCNIFARYKTWKLLLFLVLVWVAAYFLGMMIKHNSFPSEVDYNAFFMYISPSTLLTAIILVTVFVSMNSEKLPGKLISFVAPTVFSIYIINCHPVIWNEILENLFLYMKNASIGFIFWSVFRFSFIFTFGAVIFDLIRIGIFKVVKIDKLADKIEELLRKVMDGAIKAL